MENIKQKFALAVSRNALLTTLMYVSYMEKWCWTSKKEKRNM